MFESFSKGIDRALDKLKGLGKIRESNIDEALREVRIALLEADVNYKVVKEFIKEVKTKAMGQKVIESIHPKDMFVKILHDELASLIGEREDLIVEDFTITMMVGLQGSGKTTTTGKIANFVRKNYKKKPLMIACDIYRPGAVKQLQDIGKELNIEVFFKESDSVLDIATSGVQYAKENDFDYVLIDTAGRLHIDEELMNELVKLQENIEINETLLVLDSMMGQDAISVIEGFNEKLNLTGTVLAKMDGDTKGGVALSARYLTQVPIKLIGVSEKMDGLDYVDGDRLAGRILGMGDVVSLVNKAEELIDENDAEKMAKKMLEGKFNLEDFLSQLRQIQKLGPIKSILKLIPGNKKLNLDRINVSDKDIKKVEAIILSMTKEERKKPEIIKSSRKKRIANGSGTSVQEVNNLLNNFERSKKAIKQIKNNNFNLPF